MHLVVRRISPRKEIDRIPRDRVSDFLKKSSEKKFVPSIEGKFCK